MSGDSQIELLEMVTPSKKILLSENELRQGYIGALKTRIGYLNGRLKTKDKLIPILNLENDDYVIKNDREYQRTTIICVLLEYLDRLGEQLFFLEPREALSDTYSELRDELEKRLCYRKSGNESTTSPGFPCKNKDSYNYKQIVIETIKNDSGLQGYNLGLKTREYEQELYQLLAHKSTQDTTSKSTPKSPMDVLLLARKKGGGKQRKTKRQPKLKKKTKRAVKSNKRRKTRRS